MTATSRLATASSGVDSQLTPGLPGQGNLGIIYILSNILSFNDRVGVTQFGHSNEY